MSNHYLQPPATTTSHHHSRPPNHPYHHQPFLTPLRRYCQRHQWPSPTANNRKKIKSRTHPHQLPPPPSLAPLGRDHDTINATPLYLVMVLKKTSQSWDLLTRCHKTNIYLPSHGFEDEVVVDSSIGDFLLLFILSNYCQWWMLVDDVENFFLVALVNDGGGGLVGMIWIIFYIFLFTVGN